jgi:ketosteroid isomerase-like protein
VARAGAVDPDQDLGVLALVGNLVQDLVEHDQVVGCPVRDNVFVAIAKEWDGWAVAIDELVVDGEVVVGIGTYTGTNKATGKSCSARVAHIWRVQGGKAVKFEQITDSAEVLDAMH